MFFKSKISDSKPAAESLDRFSPLRAAIVFVFIGILFATLIGRVAFLETVGRQKTLQRAENQQHQDALRVRRAAVPVFLLRAAGFRRGCLPSI